MIIKGNNNNNSNSSNQQNSSFSKNKNIIKQEDLILNTKNNSVQETKKSLNQEKTKDEAFEKIDITSIDFKERVERRKGDRRRGYRRIDERSLVTRAQQEAYSIKELASKEGYQNGLLKAKNEIEQIKETLINFLKLKDEMYEKFYPHILEIALETTKTIIKKEVELSQDILQNIIMSAIEETSPDAQKITIKVNNNDCEFASASIPDILKDNGISAKINIVGDDSIEQGSCMLVANNGVIDANFKTQLAVIQSIFGIYQGGV